MPRKTNWTDARGQTAAEYLGVLLLVAAIVAAVVTLGVGTSIASGLERAICSIGAGETCEGPRSELGPDDDDAPSAGAIDRAADDLRELLDGGATPEEIAAYFGGLDPGIAEALAEEYPELVGNTDGAPIALRYDANRQAMEEEIERLEQEIEDRENDLPGGPSLPSAPWEVELREARERLDTLRDLFAGDGQFLLFDPSGDGRIAQVYGDLETADNVAISVPGAGRELTGFSGGDARRLYGQANELDPGSVATIQWLGYDTPEGITSAFGGAADPGAQDLPGFIDGITAARGGEPPHLTVVAHSYGSLVAGKSLEEHGLQVDDVVFIGSPGVGARHADELTDGSTTIWAARAEGDGVGLIGRYGYPPTSPSFGSTVFLTTGSSGHSEYFDEGSESLYNLGLIVTGNTDEVTTRP